MKWLSVCFALFAAVLGNLGETAAQALQKLTLLHSQPQITAAFAYSSSLPIHLGYFKEEGLEVEVNPMAGAAAAMQLVVSGRADFAIGNPSGAMIAIQKGADVRFYYTSIRGDIFGVALPAESGMKTLQDLKGKTIGVSSFASGGTNYVRGLIEPSDSSRARITTSSKWALARAPPAPTARSRLTPTHCGTKSMSRCSRAESPSPISSVTRAPTGTPWDRSSPRTPITPRAATP